MSRHQSQALQAGQVIMERYRILGTLYTGDHSRVYQARDLRFPEMARHCAVKDLFYDGQNEDEYQRIIVRARAEANLLAGLSHPGIPRIYDYVTFGDRAFIVLEYINGNSLQDLLITLNGTMRIEDVCRWGIDLCNVLGYLHGLTPGPVIFRNIAPGNIMIDHLRQARLVGFGRSIRIYPGEPVEIPAMDGRPPLEQLENSPFPVGDIYLLGVVMYEMLTRRNPRSGSSNVSDAEPVTDINPTVPRALSEVVMRALSEGVSDRYESQWTCGGT